MNAWNRSKSRQGFSVGFRIFDVVERRVLTDDKWWSRALEDPSSVYPKAIAPMEAIESSSLISSAVEVATQYRKFLVKGLKAGHAEFSKLYAYQYQPKFLALHFLPVALWVGYACRSRGSMLDSGRLYRSSIRAADALQEGQAKNKRRIRARRERIRRRIRR
jgi:hypothetical protein